MTGRIARHRLRRARTRGVPPAQAQRRLPARRAALRRRRAARRAPRRHQQGLPAGRVRLLRERRRGARRARHRLRRPRRRLRLLRGGRQDARAPGPGHQRRRQEGPLHHLPRRQAEPSSSTTRTATASPTPRCATWATSPTRLEEDTDFDGSNDRFTTYRDGKPARVELDKNGDGKIDVAAEFGPDGKKRLEQQDNERRRQLRHRHLLRERREGRASRRTPTATGARSCSPSTRPTARSRAARSTPTATASPTASPGSRTAWSAARRATRTATASPSS